MYTHALTRCTSGGLYVPCMYTYLAKTYLRWTLCTLYVHVCLAKMYLRWTLCTLYVHMPCQDVPLMEFIPCIYTHTLPRCTSGGVYTLYLHSYLAKMYLWWSSYLVFIRISCQDIPLVEFLPCIYAHILPRCTSSGVYVPCIYTHAS